MTDIAPEVYPGTKENTKQNKDMQTESDRGNLKHDIVIIFVCLLFLLFIQNLTRVKPFFLVGPVRVGAGYVTDQRS